jgi:hypothetical protein
VRGGAVPKNAEIFLEHITNIFGEEDVIRKFDSKQPGLPPIAVFVYRDTPEAGMITGITYGLSHADHPRWTHGKPELIVTVRSKHEDWPLSMGSFASLFRGEKRFSYGDVFTTDYPMAKDTTMTGFVVFAPALLDAKQMRVKLPGGQLPINIVGMYPIHGGEAALLAKIGLEAFWNLKNFDPYDVKRRDLSRMP